MIDNETPERVGTTFRETVAENGRGVEVHGEITEYVPDSLIAFELCSPYTIARVRYRVTPRSDGARLDVDATVRLRGVMRALEPFVGRLFARRIRRQLDAELQHLQTLCVDDADAG